MRLFLLAAALTALSPAALAQKPATVSVNPAPATLDTARKLLSMVRVDDTIALMFSKLMPLMVNATVTGLEAHSSTSELMKTMEGADRTVAKGSTRYSKKSFRQC